MMTERYNFFVLLSLHVQFFRTFVLATEQSTYFEIPAEDSWLFIADGSDKELDSCTLSSNINDHFAFHPIVDPLSRRIIAFEAIVQKNEDRRQPVSYSGWAA